MVNPQLGVSSVRELIAAAKAQPGKIDYASSGNGSAQHLVGALFNSMAGIELNHVPYKGSGPAMQDLSRRPGQGLLRRHPERAVAREGRAPEARSRVTTAKRWSELPEVPTIAEAGVPGYEATLWLNLAAPAGTPPEIVKRLADEIAQGAAGPRAAEATSAPPASRRRHEPAELLARFIRAEYEKWGRVVTQTGATVN